MKIKAIIVIHETERDMYGNAYYVAEIVNPTNGKRLYVDTCSRDNARSILLDSGVLKWENYGGDYYQVNVSTGSKRTSSLPECIYLNECHYDGEWKKALQKIGYRNLQA